MSINYHQKSDGTHIIHTDNTLFDSESVIASLNHIYHQVQGNPAYILMDFSASYHLPIREFVIELKNFYQNVDSQYLRIAIIVQPSLVCVLEAVVKTLVTREFIQYFTQEESALLWLNIERGKNVA